ncbi:MAG: hypothetical protein U0802_12665 [Candidatus Binatia bacterium]
MSRAHAVVALAALLLAAAAVARVTPGPVVTDATVAERVRHLQTPAEQLALADYYAAKAAAEQSRIAFYEALFRAYRELPGRDYEPLRVQARAELKAARESRKRLELLAAAHRNRALVAETR